MIIRGLITLCAVLFMGLASVASAQGIHERVEVAQQRIEHGMRTGALTRPEARRLRDELNMVRNDEARARSDGRLDRRERDRLNRELDRLERHIARYVRNDIRR